MHEARPASELDLEPLDATFREGGKAPLHSWFPYLEGYSPRFVQRVREAYLPKARRILEPFAGTGTTPIVLSELGVSCAWCEANPAMAFVVATKTAALLLPDRERRVLAARLSAIARRLSRLVARAVPDEDLLSRYRSTFGKSVFFESEALDQVLRLRTVQDGLTKEGTLVPEIFGLAVLGALVPASLLERAGDLRYKTPDELARGLESPLELTRERLLIIARELPSLPELRGEVVNAGSDAKKLSSTLDREWEGVITSPPYLNGTNYVRNTRLELWYLRQLSTRDDLRSLRDTMVTSGINDVAKGTGSEVAARGVERVVRELEEKAYDPRIARMVSGYFHDMALVLKELRSCLVPGAVACIDLGDSVYAGVHVRTDDLLVEVASEIGFSLEDRVHLRERISRSGVPVRQQLLVLRSPRRKARKRRAWEPAWEEFKKTLPHTKPPWSKREWGGPCHSMCSYQGKLKPAIAHHLIAAFTKKGDVVVDPFSGAGTIPFEACRMERTGIGIDISNLGYVLTLAKVRSVDPTRLERLLADLERFLAEGSITESELAGAGAVRFNSAIPDFFHEDTLREVILARRFFRERWDTGPEWARAFACTLHLLHGNRPYALSRRSHPVTPFRPTGPTEYRPLMPRLREKRARLEGALPCEGQALQQDSTSGWRLASRADAILTSPPFFDSTRFYMTNWMRFWFAGWERADFDRVDAYLETRQKRDLDVYRSVFERARESLKDEGVFVLHLGKSRKCDMGAELASRAAPWFEVADCFTESVESCESHGVRDKGSVTGHTYLVLIPR